MQRTFQKIAPPTSLFLLAVAPVFWGLTRDFLWSSFCLVLLLLLAFFPNTTQKSITRGPKTGIFGHFRAFSGLYILFSGISALFLLFFFPPSPFMSDIWQKTTPLWPEKPIIWGTINPLATYTHAIKWLAYLFLFFGLFKAQKHPFWRQYFWPMLVGGGAFISAYGIFYQSAIFGWEKSMYSTVFSGTFFSRNTYATFAGMMLIASLFTFIKYFNNASQTTVKKGLLKFLSSRKSLLLQGAIAIQAVGLLGSFSRAGIVAASLGLLFFISCLFPHKIQRKRLFFTLLLSFFTGCFLLFVISPFLPTLITDFQERLSLWQGTLTLIKSFPLTGTGLGTFSDAFYMARPPSLSLEIHSHINFSHNTYLQLMSEVGLPFALVILFLSGFSGYFLWRNRIKNQLEITAILAMLLIPTLHSLVDFSWQNPAIFILGISLLTRGFYCINYTPSLPKLTRIFRPIFFLFLLLNLAFIAATNVYMHPVTASMAQLQNGKNPLTQAKKEELKHYLETITPLYPKANWLGNLGLLYLKENDYEQATQALSHALKVSPTNPYFWAQLAILQPKLEDRLAFLGNSAFFGPYENRLVFYRLDLLTPYAKNLTLSGHTAWKKDVLTAQKISPERLKARAKKYPKIQKVLDNKL